MEKIEYQYSREECQQAVKLMAQGWVKYFVYAFIAMALIISALMVFLYFKTQNYSASISLFEAWIPFLVLVIVWPLFLVYYNPKSVCNKKAHTDIERITLEENEFIILKKDGQNEAIPFSKVSNIKVNELYIYLSVGLWKIYMIPSRIFPNKKEFIDYADRITKKSKT